MAMYSMLTSLSVFVVLVRHSRKKDNLVTPETHLCSVLSLRPLVSVVVLAARLSDQNKQSIAKSKLNLAFSVYQLMC